MRRASIITAVLLAGCPTELDPQNGCVEVATAIGSRTETCTEDRQLGEARVDAVNSYDCQLDPLTGRIEGYPDESDEYAYACALTMRNLACELVLEDGDDIDAWLAHDPVCSLILVSP